MITMHSPDRLRGILDLVENSLDEPDLTGVDLASRAYLSRFHFDRLVRASVGESPGAFRRRLLLERAAHRLGATSELVIDVAVGAGYGSPEAFTRAFNRAFGATPSEFRRDPTLSRELPCTNGIHFHPPGGLRLPAETRSSSMNVLTRMYDHHIWLAGQIIDHSAGLGDDDRDRPISLSVEGIDDAPTLRQLADRLVGQLEMWVVALEGGTVMPGAGDTSTTGLTARLTTAAARFRTLVVVPIEAGRADETFVDAVCDPPETFTLGGVLAHVLTFSAVRRTMAVGALATAGVTDLGAGDPMHFVGGTGSDAAEITRRR
jgi:AraC family transcriptional regulator